jgi:diaminohydroxyphosphoribosylaminopyrimidine deaminase/5-amino-6-(5-phosphoribosylamino)uracil reductase
MNKPSDWMQRAFDLALLGAGKVAPNPMVGCVIIKNESIIGEGWHKVFGGPHAEVEALASIPHELDAEGATAFVTLEPCSHFGKTPPCADLLIQHKIRKVYIANLDPNILVAGKGIQKLIDAGIEVELGLLGEIGEIQNQKFFTFHRKKRPFITVKYACSKDQYIAQKNGQPVHFSNDLSRAFVHKLRAEHQGILVGINTAINDNPILNTRYWPGKSPLRMVLDPNNRIDYSSQLIADTNPTILFTKSFENETNNKKWIALGDFSGTKFIEKVIEKCYELGIQSILVEGGTQTIEYFRDANLIDSIIQIESDMLLGDGIKAPNWRNKLDKIQQLGENNWIKIANNLS